ncbi:hypothetical protein FB472_1243 [Rhodoglobus vestalii]|uniref:Uncharacterized protein n=1 Tax=Rhodoglobus vestalii TaxID=193384 RepID=A0A8H2PUH6_9MICO|nr:hydrogenase maturation nickel metallochaperone HypA [Rhodoglobus vestalii]TQO19672.1 hypothetical protein FB472_1243 [Rhodoglobus vestalii]
MGTVIGLNGKPVHPLMPTIRAALLADGSASQRLEGLTVSVDEWRRVVRVVARELDRPVRTFVSAGAVHAVLRDWPADGHEMELHDQAMKEAVEASALIIEMTSPIARCPSCGRERVWRPGDRFEKSGTITCPHCGLVELQPGPR